MLNSYFKIAWRNLLKDRQFTFLNLIGLSTGLACTLMSFAYRIPLGADIFLIAGVSIMLITLLTISFQSLRAALANPVKSLKAE